jgi:dihydrofolate reductase
VQQFFDMVVACDLNRGIGAANKLPWHLPGDMKYFRMLTIGNGGSENTVIMGRNTWESIPPKFRPLPERANIVLSRSHDYQLPTGVSLCQTLDDALTIAHNAASKECFIVGGAKVYTEAILRTDCRRLYITQVLAKFDCDVFFPIYMERFQLTDQSDRQEENGIPYRYEVYERKA